MFNFGNTERIESIILRPAANFQIKNVVTLAKMSKTGKRINSISNKVYTTKKYTNIDRVNSLNLETSDYLVFSYFNKAKNKKIEIFSSYQHIKRIRKGFNNIYNIIEEHEDDLFIYDDEDYKECTLNPDFENYQSRINNLVNNNSIILIFDLIEGEDESLKPAVTIFLNSEEDYVTIKLEEFEGLCYFLDNFDLLSSSQNLYLFSYLNEISNSLELENKEYYNTETINDSNYGGYINRKKIKNKTKKEDD